MIMGPCINTIPVRVGFRDHVTTSEILSQVQNQYLAAIPYGSVGLQTIVKRCTDWPSWANLSTVVNDLSEDNFLDQLDETISFDEGICTASVHQNPDKWTDIAVETKDEGICTASVHQNPDKWTDIAVETKKEGNQVHARLYFNREDFSTELIEQLGDLLMENIIMLIVGGNRRVLRSGLKQFPLSPAASVRKTPDMLLSAELANEGLIVQEAWRSSFIVISSGALQPPNAFRNPSMSRGL